MMRSLILATALLALPSCGFTPVYSPDALSGGSISIPEISGRTGHVLRQELVRSVGPGAPGVPEGSILTIDLREGVERLGFKPDEAASRSDYVGRVAWSLNAADGSKIAEGNVREAASFNFADSAYADISAQNAAQERLAILLARSIRRQILSQTGTTPTASK